MPNAQGCGPTMRLPERHKPHRNIHGASRWA
jgi:hypothetical protein